MISKTAREPAPQAGRTSKQDGRGKTPTFLRNVAARIVAGLLMKAGLVLLTLVLGTGAVAALLVAVHRSTPGRPVSTGTVLTKLVALHDYDAAQGQFHFNFTYVVHKSFLFLTGESIQVAGSGTDDAIVNFSGLTIGQVVRPGADSVSVILPRPHLGTPAVNLSSTTLHEKGGLLTHISHLFKGDSNDARMALAAAQARISSAASNSNLIKEAMTSTRAFLVKFLARLGFKHVAVVFA